MPDQIEIGTVVSLKSGGPPMTVYHIQGDEVFCTYFEGTEMMRESFVLPELKKNDAQKHQ